jgi:aldehyde dehydrogenase
MSQLSEAAIRDVVAEVVAALQKSKPAPATTAQSAAPAIGKHGPRHGVFADAEGAAQAARKGFEQLQKKGFAGRAKVIEIVKQMCADQAERWGRIEFEETKIGRLDHKIAKVSKMSSARSFSRPWA